MSDSNRNSPSDEIESLRRALDAETLRCLDVQRQLDGANANFEEFISRGAHNARESLRDVISFSQLLAETSAGSLDSDAAVYLEHIQEGAARIQSLLEDVVDYWAGGNGDRQPCPTEMEAVLTQALLCTARQIEASGATVTHDPLPRVSGDIGILSKVLHHLVRNAIEYSGASPRVHISARREGLQWVFSVRDNGPGIEPAFQSRIFAVFRRLHGREHPGNGLGLAFCRKSIEWHGGRMWMESTPGEGSTFYFTLPPAD